MDLLLIYPPHGRLSWPRWLTHSGHYTLYFAGLKCRKGDELPLCWLHFSYVNLRLLYCSVVLVNVGSSPAQTATRSDSLAPVSRIYATFGWTKLDTLLLTRTRRRPRLIMHMCSAAARVSTAPTLAAPAPSLSLTGKGRILNVYRGV